MKLIFKTLSLTIILAGLLNLAEAQRSREVRRQGNTSASRSISRAPSVQRHMETRSAPSRSFSNRSTSPSVQSRQTTQERIYRQAPERNSNIVRNSNSGNIQNRSNNQRVFSQSVNRNPSNERLIVSRNNSNSVSRNGSFDRNRAVSRNVYQRNYRFTNIITVMIITILIIVLIGMGTIITITEMFTGTEQDLFMAHAIE